MPVCSVLALDRKAEAPLARGLVQIEPEGHHMRAGDHVDRDAT